MLIAFARVVAAKAYADRGGYDIDPNQVAHRPGCRQRGRGPSSGMVVNGSRQTPSTQRRARSQLSGVTVAILVVVTLLFLTGLFENLPEATLAAVVIAASSSSS